MSNWLRSYHAADTPANGAYQNHANTMSAFRIKEALEREAAAARAASVASVSAAFVFAPAPAPLAPAAVRVLRQVTVEEFWQSFRSLRCRDDELSKLQARSFNAQQRYLATLSNTIQALCPGAGEPIFALGAGVVSFNHFQFTFLFTFLFFLIFSAFGSLVC